jgi:anti-anti-sigma factor
MANIPLSLNFEEKETYTICVMTGDLAGEAIARLRSAMDDLLLKGTKRLVILLDDIHNFNSTALDTILALQNKFYPKGCELVLIVSQSEIRELLDITCCSSFFPIYESLKSFELEHQK